MSQRHYDSHYKHLIVRRLRASSGVVEDNDILAVCRAGRLQIPASQELCEELFVHFEGPEERRADFELEVLTRAGNTTRLANGPEPRNQACDRGEYQNDAIGRSRAA